MMLSIKLEKGEAAILSALHRQDRIIVELEITRDTLLVLFGDDPTKK